MPLDEYEKDVAHLVKELWREEIHALHWSANPMSEDQPWSEGWCDIYIKEICDPLNLNWLLTIVPPGDTEEEGYGTIKVSFDAQLVFEFANKDQLAATSKKLIRDDGISLSLPIKDESSNIEENSFYWSMYRQDHFLDDNTEVLTYKIPVWSKEQIEESLITWIYQISGYKFDLSFQDDLDSPITQEINEKLREIESGRAKTFDIGDGVRVSDSVMDTLMKDPTVAAEITSEVKKILKDKGQD
jgi:hypothetical protein